MTARRDARRDVAIDRAAKWLGWAKALLVILGAVLVAVVTTTWAVRGYADDLARKEDVRAVRAEVDTGAARTVVLEVRAAEADRRLAALESALADIQRQLVQIALATGARVVVAPPPPPNP